MKLIEEGTKTKEQVTGDAMSSMMTIYEKLEAKKVSMKQFL
jgi:hypothetical protein